MGDKRELNRIEKHYFQDKTKSLLLDYLVPYMSNIYAKIYGDDLLSFFSIIMAEKEKEKIYDKRLKKSVETGKLIDRKGVQLRKEHLGDNAPKEYAREVLKAINNGNLKLKESAISGINRAKESVYLDNPSLLLGHGLFKVDKEGLRYLINKRLNYEKDKEKYLISLFGFFPIDGPLNTLLAIDKEEFLINGFLKYFSKKELIKIKDDGSRQTISTYRNRYIGHDYKDIYMPIEDIDNLLEAVKSLAQKFNKDIFNNDKEYSFIVSKCNELKDKLSIEPLNIEDIKDEIPSFSEKKLIARFGDFLSEDKKIIYLVKKEELKKYFYDSSIDTINELIADFKKISDTSESLDIANSLSRYVHIKFDKGEDISSNMRSILGTGQPYLSKLVNCGLAPDILKKDQIRELFTSSIVFPHSSILLDNDARSFFKELLISFKNNNVITCVDYQTRLEMYDIEVNTKDDEELAQSAKSARSLLSLLHDLDYVHYIGSIDSPLRGVDNFIYEFAKKYPDNRFVVLVDIMKPKARNEFVNKIKDAGLYNILPVWFDGTDKQFMIDASLNTTLKGFCNVNLLDDQEIDEISDETNEDIEDYKLIKETNKLIEVTKIPSENGDVYYGDGSKIELKKEINRGGEGIIYDLDNGDVAKIYLKNKLTEFRRNKLENMLDIEGLDKYFAKPLKLLYDEDHNFLGYEMKKVNDNFKKLSVTLLRLYRKGIDNWDRKSLVKVCIRLVEAISLAHENNLIIGDLDFNNILLNVKDYKDPKIKFVDFDSMQYKGYPCPVGHLEYTNPRIYIRENNDSPVYGNFLRLKEDDLYALAVMLFRILVDNAHPCIGKGENDLKQAMKEYNFAYKKEDYLNNRIPNVDLYLIWNNTPDIIKDLFSAVFERKSIISTNEWLEGLNEYLKLLDDGSYTSELIPNMYHDTKDKTLNIYFKCESCEQESNMPKDRYARLKDDDLKLCRKCENNLNTLKNKPINEDTDKIISRTFKCAKCSRDFEVDNYYDAYRYKIKPNIKILCNMCRGEHE